MFGLKRRDFITLLGGAAAWPLAARAQQPIERKTIGFLSGLTASDARPWVSAFVQRLGDLGWIENRTVAMEYRWLDGHTERASEAATELVRLKVDVIVTHATEPTLAFKKATSIIPIVFAVANDPVGTGLVSSLSRPGGNVTGFSLQQTDLGTKRLGLLREVFPDLRRLAVMFNADNPSHAAELDEVKTAARTLGIDVITMNIRRSDDIAPAFETLRGRAEALYVLGDVISAANRVRINALALGDRLKTMHSGRIFVQSGGLMSYAPDFRDLFRRAADYVDKILKGAKPADLPVQQPTKFELTINLKTAKALGLDVPTSLLATADEVIE